MKKLIPSILILMLGLTTLFQATAAVFEETVTVAGTSFTVGTDAGGGATDTNTALKILANVSSTAEGSNLVDSVAGLTFDNITSEWTDQMTIKIHNQGTTPLDLISAVDYVSDPDVLRDDIYIDISEWDDLNGDGVVDTGEVGTSYGYDTILRLRNDTYLLGEITAGETRGFLLTFDGTGVTDTNFGMTADYDFTFTGVGE